MANGVMLSKIYETTTTGDFPTATANTWTQGVNAPGGPVEFLMLRKWGFIVFSGQRSRCFSLLSGFSIGREIPN